MRDVLGQDERSAEQPWRTGATLRFPEPGEVWRGAASREGGWPAPGLQSSRLAGRGDPEEQDGVWPAALPGCGALCRAGSGHSRADGRPGGRSQACGTSPSRSSRDVHARQMSDPQCSEGSHREQGGGPPDPGAQGPPSLHTEHTSLSSYYQMHFTVKTKSPDMLVKERSLRHPSRDTHSRLKPPGCGSTALGRRRERRGSQ